MRTIVQQTSYQPVIMDDTTFKWICPSCIVEIIPLIRQLHDFLKNDENVYWNGLRYFLKEKTAQ